MRLVTRTIWRAFPELDRYSDEHCARFVRAARRGRPLWLRLSHWLLQLLTLAAVAAGVIWGLSQLGSSFYFGDRSLGVIYFVQAIMGLLFLVGAATAMLAMLTVRHRLLRRRIAWIFRERGRCARCKYSMIGVLVDESCRAVCPECGSVADVDPSLGELVRGADGRGRYEPSHAVYKGTDRAVVRRRIAKTLKWTGIVVGTIAVIAGTLLGVNEWRIRSQVQRARALPRGDAAMAELIASTFPTLPADPRDSNKRLPEVIEKAQEAQLRFTESPGRPAFTSIDGSWILSRETGSPEFAEEYRLNAEASAQLLVILERDGLFKDLRAALAKAVPLRAQPTVDGRLLADGGSARNSALRGLARWSAARMRQAVVAGDPSAFGMALDEVLGLAEALDMTPTLMERMNSQAIEAMTHWEVRPVLATHPDASWLDAIEGAFQRHRLGTRPGLPYQGQRIIWRDLARWMFSDPSLIRWGAVTPGLQRRLSSAQTAAARVGTLEENLEAADAYFGEMAKRAAQPRWLRTPLPPGVPAGLAINTEAYAMERALLSADTSTAERLGMRTLLALEQFRLDHGDYPDSLDALVGKQLDALPLDPFSGKPLCYKVNSTATGNLRTFILYSVGLDGIDNGGERHPRQYEVWSSRTAPGYDYLFTDVAP